MEDNRIVSIFTAPRSGTWWHLYFFYFYHHASIGTENVPLPMAYETLFDYRRSIGRRFMVQHSICPGFERRDWPFQAQWNELAFSIPGYNGKHAALGLDPGNGADGKLVYIYRNPLDHFVSMFRHGQNHTDDIIRTFRGEDGRKIPLDTPFDFALHHGIPCYVKQYLTFKAMSELHPDAVLMRPYEVMTADPEAHFRLIFDFYGMPLQEDAFRVALKRSGRDSMSNLENAISGAIGGDQKDSSSRHIRDGSSGQWRKHFSDAELQEIRARFSALGIDLDSFMLSGSPQSAIGSGRGA